MERIDEAKRAATKEFVSNVGRALSGLMGGPDEVCEFFIEHHTRHVAQAVLHLMGEVRQVREQAEKRVVKEMRREAGYL